MQASPEPLLCGCLTRNQARCFIGAVWVVNAFLALSNLLMAAGQTLPYGLLNHQLNMSDEANFGSWYSSILLFLLGLAALRHYVDDRNLWCADSAAVRRGWVAFAMLAGLVSADEVCNLHEGIRRVLQLVVDERQIEVNAIWSLVLLPLLTAVAVVLFVFLLRAFRATPVARRLALGGLAAWSGSIIVELTWRSILFTSTFGGKMLMASLEETLEIVGTTLLLMALAAAGFARAPKGPWAAIPEESAAGSA